LQALTQRSRQVEEDLRAQLAVAFEEAKISQEHHESEAASWSFHQTSLESQLAKQQQESSAAAEQFKAQVRL
jgi:hypothetical protein